MSYASCNDLTKEQIKEIKELGMSLPNGENITCDFQINEWLSEKIIYFTKNKRRRK